ncbi:hypothetical protein [Candidatus Oscillochloris fontis]|uniref:hypothetical protein n=1 Tax=Candidatus Oscillochloris fontis TaxID=2496868 RepID=UPI00101D5400|nr:hypothetical protein [Candidatus Oscillochloris fontis]
MENNPIKVRFSQLKSFILYILIFVTLFVVTSLYTLQVNKVQVMWDGVFYFSTLRSAFFDLDVNYINEAQQYPWMTRTYGESLPNGLISNPFPVGSAILWSPFYAIADLICRTEMTSPCDGFGKVYVAAVMIGTVFWGTLGIFLTHIVLKVLFPTTPIGLRVLAILTTLLGTPLVFYLSVDVDYAHGNQFFAVGLLIFMTVTLLRKETVNILDGLAYGMTIGLVFLVRWQDVIFGLFAIPVLMNLRRTHRLGFALATGVGLSVAALPQLLIWRVLYGSWLTVPQSGNFLNPSNAEPLKFFFSTWNGVFLWHPLILFGLVGLARLFRYPRLGRSYVWYILAVVTGVSIVMEVFISMIARDWWAGGAFGQRRLVSLAPLICVGILQLFEEMRLVHPWIHLGFRVVMVLLIALNLLTLLRYHQGALPFNPSDPSNYLSRQVYDHYDYGRRFTDLLTGQKP